MIAELLFGILALGIMHNGCGIVGVVINNKVKTRIDNIYNMYKNQESRGKDGFGIVDATRMNRVRGTDVFDVFGWKNAKFFNELKPKTALLFHHRRPTSTANTVNTAHPFINERGNATLIHNGGISNYRELYDELVKDGHKFESFICKDKDGKAIFNDSETILHLFEREFVKAKNKIVPAIKSMFNILEGGYAVAIGIKGTRNIILFKKTSPIVISKDIDDNYYFSSELYGLNNYYNNKSIMKIGDTNIDDMELIKVMEDGEIGILSETGYEMLHVHEFLKPKVQLPNKIKGVDNISFRDDGNTLTYWDVTSGKWVVKKRVDGKFVTVKSADNVKVKSNVSYKRGWSKRIRKQLHKHMDAVLEANGNFMLDYWDYLTLAEQYCFKECNVSTVESNVNSIAKFIIQYFRHNAKDIYEANIESIKDAKEMLRQGRNVYDAFEWSKYNEKDNVNDMEYEKDFVEEYKDENNSFRDDKKYDDQMDMLRSYTG